MSYRRQRKNKLKIVSDHIIITVLSVSYHDGGYWRICIKYNHKHCSTASSHQYNIPCIIPLWFQTQNKSNKLFKH